MSPVCAIYFATMSRFDCRPTPTLSRGFAEEKRTQDRRLEHLVAPTARRPASSHQPRLVSDDVIALRSAAIAGVVHLPLLMVSDEIRNGQLVHLLPSWAPKRYVVHAVYPSKRG